jgi:hypothetical protein
MIHNSDACPHLDVGVLDGVTGVTLVECARCRHRFERAEDGPNLFSSAGVVALVGGLEADWQYVGLWRDARVASLLGLDHYQRRPSRARVEPAPAPQAAARQAPRSAQNRPAPPKGADRRPTHRPPSYGRRRRRIV